MRHPFPPREATCLLCILHVLCCASFVVVSSFCGRFLAIPMHRALRHGTNWAGSCTWPISRFVHLVSHASTRALRCCGRLALQLCYYASYWPSLWGARVCKGVPSQLVWQGRWFRSTCTPNGCDTHHIGSSHCFPCPNTLHPLAHPCLVRFA